MIILLEPTLDMEKDYFLFAKDWSKEGEEITPYSARLLGRTYQEWLNDTERDKRIAPMDFVTSSTYFVFDKQQKIVGAVNIRDYLNESLFRCGGHIGGGICPSYRGKGYGSQILHLSLEIVKKLKMKEVLVTCDKKNIPSMNAIKSNGGVLENEILEENEIIQRYWIGL